MMVAPKSSIFHPIFHEINHLFWGTPIDENPYMGMGQNHPAIPMTSGTVWHLKILSRRRHLSGPADIFSSDCTGKE
jgi:hypothetical protein